MRNTVVAKKAKQSQPKIASPAYHNTALWRAGASRSDETRNERYSKGLPRESFGLTFQL